MLCHELNKSQLLVFVAQKYQIQGFQANDKYYHQKNRLVNCQIRFDKWQGQTLAQVCSHEKFDVYQPADHE